MPSIADCVDFVARKSQIMWIKAAWKPLSKSNRSRRRARCSAGSGLRLYLQAVPRQNTRKSMRFRKKREDGIQADMLPSRGGGPLRHDPGRRVKLGARTALWPIPSCTWDWWKSEWAFLPYAGGGTMKICGKTCKCLPGKTDVKTWTWPNLCGSVHENRHGCRVNICSPGRG